MPFDRMAERISGRWPRAHCGPGASSPSRERFERLTVEHEVYGGKIFVQVLERGGSGDEQYVRSTLEQPGESDLSRGCIQSSGRHLDGGAVSTGFSGWKAEPSGKNGTKGTPSDLQASKTSSPETSAKL